MGAAKVDEREINEAMEALEAGAVKVPEASPEERARGLRMCRDETQSEIQKIRLRYEIGINSGVAKDNPNFKQAIGREMATQMKVLKYVEGELEKIYPSAPRLVEPKR